MASFDDVSSFLKYEIDQYFPQSITNYGKCGNLYKWKIRYELQKSLLYIKKQKKLYNFLMKIQKRNDALSQIIEYLYNVKTSLEWRNFVLQPNLYELFEKYNYIPIFETKNSYKKLIFSYMDSFSTYEKQYIKSQYYFLNEDGIMTYLETGQTVIAVPMSFQLSEYENCITIFDSDVSKGVLVPCEKTKFLMKMIYIYNFFSILEE